jgi:uncharacterized protein (TIGR03067 family)
MLDGVWEIKRAVILGQEIAHDNSSWTILGSRLVAEPSGTMHGEGVIQINVDCEPKTLDFTVVDGVHQDISFKCIFELRGDLLIICHSAPGADRPTEFSSAWGNGQGIVVLQRRK